MSAARLPLSLLVPTALLAAACGGGAPATGTTTEPLACSIPASCTTADAECLGEVDNAGLSRFGLRMVQLDVTRPPGLTAGFAGTLVADSVLPANDACNLPGSGTFTWLLRFDLAAGTLETGGVRPPADAARGYGFAREALLGFPIAPATLPLDMGAGGRFTTPTPGDVNLPLFFDAAGATAVVLPLRAARFTGALSSSNDCVGRYEPAVLRPADDCTPVEGRSAFRTGGKVSALVRLADADRVLLPAFSETLCARLAGDDLAYVAYGADGRTACKRDAAGRILFQGDACAAAGEACADSVRVEADFAASSVRIDD